MRPNGLNRAQVASLVARAIHDIEESDDERRQELLCALIDTAWGSPPAQDQ